MLPIEVAQCQFPIIDKSLNALRDKDLKKQLTSLATSKGSKFGNLS